MEVSQDIITEHNREQLIDHDILIEFTNRRIDRLEQTVKELIEIVKHQDYNIRMIVVNLPTIWKGRDEIAFYQGKLEYTHQKLNEHLFEKPIKKGRTFEYN